MVATSPSSDRPDGLPPPPVLWLAAGIWALGMCAMVASGVATGSSP